MNPKPTGQESSSIRRQVEGRAANVQSMPQLEYFSIAELAQRWRCSRGTVYNRLRALGMEVLDFAPRGKKGRKVVHIRTVLEVERRRTRRLS